MTTDQTRNQDCPRCGMPIASGSSPTTSGDETYCCQGCASGGECTCPGHEH